MSNPRFLTVEGLVKETEPSLRKRELTKVPLFKPSLGAEELAALAELFKSGWIGLGPRTAQFEEHFAEYIGAPYAVGVNSCTAALHLSLQLAGVTGGEVIVPAITFVSTAHAAAYNGAKPVFVDVDEDTLCLDVDDLQQKISSKTKAIVAVHLGGHPCDMDPILQVAKDNNVPVLEDVANACGGEYRGRKLGSLGAYGCFSFEAKKNMTTGDGGMITTADQEAAAALKRLRWCGINKDTWKRFSGEAAYSWQYDVAEVGYKYNMNDIMAAIGLVQLQKLDAVNTQKRRIIQAYREAFRNLNWLQCPEEKPWAFGAYWLFIVRVRGRERFMKHLADRGITTGVHFMPVHLFSCYRDYEAKVPVAERVWRTMVSLPLYATMTDTEFEAVVDAVCSYNPA